MSEAVGPVAVIRACSILSVSAASRKAAWVVARDVGRSTALFRTTDGGRTWKRIVLLRR
jgi:photosystem II stability/assembly factor-like uncharacterized protein